MPDRSPSPARFRSVSLLVAAGLALLFSGVVLFYALRGRATPPPRQALRPDPGPRLDAAVLPPDFTSVVPVQASGPARVQFVDRRDPARVAGELLWERLDPLAQGRYTVESPRVWIYLRDGSSLLVRAGSGELKIPGRAQEPESGRFDGGVEARLFPAREAGSQPIDPDHDTPLLLVFAESFIFDRITGELMTPSRFSLSTPEAEFQGVGLHIVYDEIRERPTVIEVASRDFIHAHAAQAKDGGGQAPSHEATAATPNQPVAQAGNQPEVPIDAPAVREDYFHADLAEGVLVLTQGRSIEADRLRVWCRLVEGRLPDGGFGSDRSVPKNDGEAAAAPPDPALAGENGTSSQPATISPESPPSALPAETISSRIAAFRALLPSNSPASLTPVADDDVLITGSGPLTVVALDSPPAELARNELFLTFESEDTAVALADRQSGAGATASSVSYGGTTRTAHLRSEGKDANLFDASGSSLTGSDVTIGLESGIVQIAGDGRAADADGREITWTTQADFEFAIEQQAGEARLGGLREARLTGQVRAHDDRSSIVGDYLHASFEPGAGGEAAGNRHEKPNEGDPLLTRVIVEGNARAATLAEGGGEEAPAAAPVEAEPAQAEDWLKADRIDTLFAPREDRKRSDPSVVTATGNVSAQRTDTGPTKLAQDDDTHAETPTPPQVSNIRAELLEARLALDERSRVIVTSVDLADRASPDAAPEAGPVTFERSDGIRAECENLHADVPTKTVDLHAARAIVSRHADSVFGPHIHLNGSRNLLGVTGEGAFTHSPPEPAGHDGATAESAGGPVTVSWKESGVFDDEAGMAECIGEMQAVSRPDVDTLQILRAGRAVLSFAPDDEAALRPPQDSSLAAALRGKRLLRAEAFGDPHDPPQPEDEPAEPATLATVEIRHYASSIPAHTEGPDGAVGGAGRRLDRLLYLAGAKIIADNELAELTVPSPGRAVALDHRAATKAEARPQPAAASSIQAALADSASRRGSSLFVWNTSMHYEHTPGILTLRGGVQLAHKPLGEKGAFSLDADELDAFLRRDPAATETPLSSNFAGEQLARAVARGSVSVETPDGNIQLTADEIDFDAARQILVASARPGGRVTVIDKRQASPFAARRLSWNLVTDEILIVQPLDTVVAPHK